MANVNSVEKPGSDIESYVNSMEKVYSLQLEKINFMKMRLVNFKNLLKEEMEISQKVIKMNELMGSMYESSFQNQSQFSKNEVINLDDNCDEDF